MEHIDTSIYEKNIEDIKLNLLRDIEVFLKQIRLKTQKYMGLRFYNYWVEGNIIGVMLLNRDEKEEVYISVMEKVWVIDTGGNRYTEDTAKVKLLRNYNLETILSVAHRINKFDLYDKDQRHTRYVEFPISF